MQYKKYGKEPHRIVLVHGGPGAPGSMQLLAVELSKKYGIIEPWQSEDTIEGQIDELAGIVTHQCHPIPVVLIGHSWGAWLSLLLAAKYQVLIKKIILIGSGVFESKYNENLMKIRMDRLPLQEQEEVNNLLGEEMTEMEFKRFGSLMEKADSYCNEGPEESVEFQPEIYQSIWSEADQLRNKGELIEKIKAVKCRVIAIHGDYDPHPKEGVERPLSEKLDDFDFYCLDKCGHYPWKEKYAKKPFFRILNKELKN